MTKIEEFHLEGLSIKPKKKKKDKPKTHYRKIKKRISGGNVGPFKPELEKLTKDGSKVHLRLYLIDVINHYMWQTRSLIEVLRLLTKSDKVTIIIHTPGGAVNMGVAIIDALQSCKAPVHGHAVGYVASMGPLILFSCDTVEIDKHAELMFHGVQSFDFGSVANMKHNMDAILKHAREIMNSTALGFLTESEIEKFTEGDIEYRFTGPDLRKRLNRWKKRKAGNKNAK